MRLSPRASEVPGPHQEIGCYSMETCVASSKYHRLAAHFAGLEWQMAELSLDVHTVCPSTALQWDLMRIFPCSYKKGSTAGSLERDPILKPAQAQQLRISP